ncbi:hypothetical protein HPB47_007840 [Ixodes persulcatus]|uniref:Uncharacterized protein n=1 Tax=Ixodes persulcatus TaxID=34615 RepID=A0AC60P6E8_IXOPE|nr:hypothetical protein HPB47_007840 [Ixodes persulcatus]
MTIQLACYFIEKGARAVLSLQSSRSAAVAHSVCARFHIPFLTVRESTSADRQGGGSRSFQLKFYPDQADVSSAFLDLLLALEWRSFTLIYNSDSAFVRLRDVMKYAFRPPGNVRLVQCCAERQSYDSIISELKAKHELRVMLDLTPSEVDRFMTKVYPAKMAPTVFLGYRVPGLRPEELLEICLPDWGGAERKSGMPYCDPILRSTWNIIPRRYIHLTHEFPLRVSAVNRGSQPGGDLLYVFYRRSPYGPTSTVGVCGAPN